MENQQVEEIEQVEQQEHTDAEPQKRKRGRPRKGEVVVKPVKTKKEFKTHDPNYFRNYYNLKIKPVKEARRKVREDLKQQLQETKHEEIINTTSNIINKIKNINNQDNELDKISKMMLMICHKLDIKFE